MNSLEKYKKTIIAIVKKHLPSAKIYLFGSRARKTNLEGADIDIALDTGTSIDLSILFKITNDIDESTIPVYVDVVDFNNVASDFKIQILKDKVLWKN